MHGTNDKFMAPKKNEFRRSFPWVVAWVLSYGTMVDVNVALCSPMTVAGGVAPNGEVGGLGQAELLEVVKN